MAKQKNTQDEMFWSLALSEEVHKQIKQVGYITITENTLPTKNGTINFTVRCDQQRKALKHLTLKKII